MIEEDTVLLRQKRILSAHDDGAVYAFLVTFSLICFFLRFSLFLARCRFSLALYCLLTNHLLRFFIQLILSGMVVNRNMNKNAVSAGPARG
jgi:hypothetical protein